MKVKGLNPFGQEIVTRTGPDEAVSPAPRSTIFNRTLTSLAESEFERHIKSSIDKITEQGKRMCEKADLKELNIYKEMIRSLISETVSNAFEFYKTSRLDAKGRGKVYALINKVNAKLDEITRSILDQEKEHISLLADVDEIRGMLVDMLL